MMYRVIGLSVVICVALAMWGCKKDGASVGAKEADEVVQTNLEVEPEEDLQQEPDQTTEPDTSPPQEQTATQPPEQPEKSEDVFTVKLETTKGDIIIDVHRDWAPLGAERFHELVSVGFYDDVAFFRVIKDFMAQTGVSGKPKLNSKWGRKKIKDEPARKHNMRGNVSFAMAGPNSRTTQFFINLVDNKQLDPMGFAPFGMVRDMTQVDALFSGYGDGPPRGKGPNQQRLKQRGNKYLKKQFPDLDYIISAKIIEE